MVAGIVITDDTPRETLLTMLQSYSGIIRRLMAENRSFREDGVDGVWQPGFTAPQDKTTFLGLYRGCDGLTVAPFVFASVWPTSRIAGISQRPCFRVGWGGLTLDGDEILMWRRLPKAPKALSV